MNHVEDEIVRLHAFFVDWMTGAIEQTDENFAQFSDSMGANFYIVTPSGEITLRPALVAGLYNTYDQRRNFRIWIENVTVRHTLNDVVVATYEEWIESEENDSITTRLSTVVLTVDESLPNGLLWQCVHETWLSRQRN